MDGNRLKEQEARFLTRYPGGFQNPEMLQIAKRHNVPKLVTFAREELGPEAFEEPLQALEAVGKLISRSSLVSVFEKTAFRNHLSSLPAVERLDLADAIRELLHGTQQSGFQRMTALLAPYKLAKWTIITALLYYRNPQEELVIKPTTVKSVIGAFQLEGLVYQPRPDYAFYDAYRSAIRTMKQEVGEALQVENGAFCGFLMYAVGLYE